jgi:rod shape-determining protein MreC
MQGILHLIIAQRKFVSLLVTTLLSLLLITASPMQQAAALRFLSMTIFFPLQIVLSQSTRVKNIFAENRRLKEEVIRLSASVAQLKEASIENKRLRNLLSIAQEYDYDLLPVRVIARDPAEAYRSVVVSAGKNDSVEMLMPLIGEKGVVGKVVQVMHKICLVQLLRDPSNRTSVLFSRTRTIGILETENGNNFFVRCRSHEPIDIGDTIVTSGLGGIYPRGLTVGIVKNIDQIRDPLFKKVNVDLSMDFDHLEELFIIRISPQWSAFRNELDSIEFNNE